MSSGLQRRRGGTGSGSPTKSSAQYELNNDSSEELTSSSHKIGYDPNDIGNGSGSSPSSGTPLLTLMEEVLLIGLKDREGYLSFWNDNISYALRGLIILELAFRGKIAMINDPARRKFELSDRLIEVIDGSLTGEVLLDELMKFMKTDPDHLSVSQWIDLLSGETWNMMKINYQLKQVRERLAKGLVDKGILRTERKNFFLFDMATHPLVDYTPKKLIIQRISSFLLDRNISIENDSKFFPDSVSFQALRSICLCCGCYAANVLEKILLDMNYDQCDKAVGRADELIANFGIMPFALNNRIGTGLNLNQLVEEEIAREKQHNKDSDIDLRLEVVAAVLNVFGKMDSIL